MKETEAKGNVRIPTHINIVTFDLHGKRVDTGEAINTRPTGIVAQTHQLLKGFMGMQEQLRFTVSRNIYSDSPSQYHAITPEGATVGVREIHTGFQQYFKNPSTGHVDRQLVTHFYEERVFDSENPVYHSLAEQYADMIRGANTSALIFQNTNPLVSMLKAEELEMLDPITLGQLNVTVVMHDIEGYEQRLTYAATRLIDSKINLKLVAISKFVQQQLQEFGFPDERLFKISNGIDIDDFDKRLKSAKDNNLFETVRARNKLPDKRSMIIVPARRVEHKGHLDVINAIKELKDQGKLGDIFVVFTGNQMVHFQSSSYENHLRQAIKENDLEETVLLLDQLTYDEMVSCFSASKLSVLPSTKAEGFGYANIEAMLAGVPVITSALGGPLDYIEDKKTGLFVKPHNPSSIANAIYLALHDQDFYKQLSREGRKKAEEYGIPPLLQGYQEAINAGNQYLPIRINPDKIFDLFAQGGNTDLYSYTSHATGRKSPYLMQIYKKSKDALDLSQLKAEYHYLRELFADMPGLIPNQRIVNPDSDNLRDIVILKEKVEYDPARCFLKDLQREDLSEETLRQLQQFVDITKSAFSFKSTNDALTDMSYRIPDITDSSFANILIDRNGNVKFVDTNWLIKTDYLRNGDKRINVERNRIYNILFRRLMYIESKFFNRTKNEFKQDPFYLRYIKLDDFDRLFEKSRETNEEII